MHQFLTAAIAASLGLAMAGSVQAHGEAKHEAKHAGPAQPLHLEQRPWGIAAPAKAPRRTVVLHMNDKMRFVSDRIQVRQGETLRIVVHNDGRQLHEFVLGTRAELEAHALQMLKFPTMEHDEPYMAHVAPGKQGEIDWTFNRAGEFEFACLIAGHFQAGMVGVVSVSAVAK